MRMRGWAQRIAAPLRLGGAVLMTALVMWPTALRAQAHGGKPLTPTGSQNLAFGTVFPGIATHVLYSDALKGGQFQIRGQNSALVQVTFTLPGAMTGPAGASLPMSFSAADAAYSQAGTVATATVFDPRVPLSVTMSGQGRLTLFLGGTLTPPSRITPGAYSATITITVAYL